MKEGHSYEKFLKHGEIAQTILYFANVKPIFSLLQEHHSNKHLPYIPRTMSPHKMRNQSSLKYQ
ncbi:hypothetical protein NXX56_28215 [Bacteroides thetaiotaomicron]|nr:hypothetical protein [Bacteroides thetaiotaomicron]